MREDSSEHVSSLLRDAGLGDEDARRGLISALYTELHGLAHRQMADQSPGHTLQTTALVNEAVVRLMRGAPPTGREKAQFLALAAKAMRSILIDHARAKRAAKRGGSATAQPLDELVLKYEERALDLLALDEALERLEARDPELARIVELRFFGGRGSEEIAEALAVSRRTVERGWRAAQAWLAAELGGSSPAA